MGIIFIGLIIAGVTKKVFDYIKNRKITKELLKSIASEKVHKNDKACTFGVNDYIVYKKNDKA